MGNVLGGGAHAVGGTDIQEFLVTSFCDNVTDAMLANVAVHDRVKEKLKKRLPQHALGKGDEGAWVAPLSNIEALELVVEAATEISGERNVEIKTGLDDLQHLSISTDGHKIALCGIIPGRLWVGDLVIN